MEEKKKRIQWLDVAKGICMLSVIAGHLDLLWVNRVVYSYHLTLFFILSGYTLKKDFSHEGLNKRFQGLMVPYFVTCLAIMAVDVVNVITLIGKTNLLSITWRIGRDLSRGFFASGTFTKLGSAAIGTIGAIWFLPATFFATLTTQAMLHYIPDKRIRYAAAGIIAVVASVSATLTWFPFSIQAGLYAVPFLLLGYDLRESGALEKLRLKHFLLGLALVAVGVWMDKAKIFFVTAEADDPVISVVCGLASSLCIIWISQKIEGCKPLAWVGRNSVYFLCIHIFEMETLKTWHEMLLEAIGIDNTAGVRFLQRVIFCALGTAVILLWKKRSRPVQRTEENVWHHALDMAKALWILFLLTSDFSVDNEFGRIAFSIPVSAFVLCSGYCFATEKCPDLRKKMGGYIYRYLLPYCVFGILYILLIHRENIQEFRDVLLGFGGGDGEPAAKAAGLAWIILLMFQVESVYTVLEKFISNEATKGLIVLGISVLGQCLGEWGVWLPWNLDCAMYALMFFYLGHCIKKFGIMEWLCERRYFYFALSCIWAYQISQGTMDMAARGYENYGITVLGTVSGAVLAYMLCHGLCSAKGGHLHQIGVWIGRNAMYIMAIHGALHEVVSNWVGKYLTPGHIYFAIAVIAIQLLLGGCAGSILEAVQKVLCRTLKRNTIQ